MKRRSFKGWCGALLGLCSWVVSVTAWGDESWEKLPEDRVLAMMVNSGYNPRSEWLEQEKANYRQVLSAQQIDVLVVPIKSINYGFDRIERSLMTRYVADAIENTTNLRVANPDLVSRALGEGSRQINPKEVYILANDLKAKYIVWLFAGHQRDLKMKFVLHLQVASGSSNEGATTDRRKSWEDLEFSDTRLPAEVVLEKRAEILDFLGFKHARSFSVEDNQPKQIAQLSAIFGQQPHANISSVEAAVQFQMLGYLTPLSREKARERFFEKSLVALSHVAPSVSVYSQLKSRALLNLKRRPSALSVLKEAKSPIEKELLARINGNLTAIFELKKSIHDAAENLFTQIDYIDLLRKYEWPKLEEKELDEIARRYENSSWVVSRRLSDGDSWFRMSNVLLKGRIENVFPKDGISANELLINTFVMGQAFDPSSYAELAVYEYITNLLTKQSVKWNVAGKNQIPAPLDQLFLFEAIGEDNLIRNVEMELHTYGKPESALTLLGRYELVYKENVDMAYERFLIVNRLAEIKDGATRDALEKQAQEAAIKVYHWSAGQTTQSKEAVQHLFGKTTVLPFYNGDYPRRWYWFNNVKILDRPMKSQSEGYKEIENFRTALEYVDDDYKIVKDFENSLHSIKASDQEIEDLRKSVESRFIGSVSRAKDIAKYKMMRDGVPGAIWYLEQLRKEMPTVWFEYGDLGSIYSNSADYKKARDIYLSYPFFKSEFTDKVDLSNKAYFAAIDLFWRGAVEESAPLFKLAADYKTFSNASLESEGRLALLDGDYTRAAGIFLVCMRRYEGSSCASEYATLVFLSGHADAGWALHRKLSARRQKGGVELVPFVALRMEGKTSVQIRKWVLENSESFSNSSVMSQFLLADYFIDRDPEPGAMNELREELLKKKKSFAIAVDSDSRSTTQEVKSATDVGAKAVMDEQNRKWFANIDAYDAIRVGDFQKAYKIFEQRTDWKPQKIFDTGLLGVLGAWSCVRVGEVARLESVLKKATVMSYQYWVMTAVVEARNKRVDAAIMAMRRAIANRSQRYFVPDIEWYIVFEMLEWLSTEFGAPEYLELALEMAQSQKRVSPQIAWPHYVEAKYSRSNEVRVKALGTAIYLDRNSKKLAAFSEDDRAQANRWLKKNSPFQLNREVAKELAL